MSKRIITAIDVGSSKITTVISSVDENQNPNVIGVCSYPSKGIKKGVVVNIEEATNSISESITAAERMAGLTISDVVVTINGELVTSLNNRGVVAVSSSEITIDDTYRAIENARTLSLPQDLNPLHIIPREFVVDSQGGIKYPIGMSGNRLEVETHIITSPNSYWRNIKKSLEQLALYVSVVVFAGWESSCAVLTETEKELGVTLLDIGAGTVTISIFEEGSITYSGCVPLGGGNITSDLAIGLQVSLEEAEKIKLNMEKILSTHDNGEDDYEDKKTPALLRKQEESKADGKEIDSDDLYNVTKLGVKSQTEISKSFMQQIVNARLEEILEKVRNIVAQAGYNVAMPAGLVFTAGTALVNDSTKIGQGVFGVPCRVGYPSGLSGMVEEISDPSFSAVRGLIKYAMEDNMDSNTGSGSKGMNTKFISDLVAKVVAWVKSLMP